MLKWCVLAGLDWAKPMIFLLLHVTCSCIFHAYIQFFFISILLILICVGTSLSLSLSLSRLVALWHPNISLLRPRTLFILRHLLLILPPLTFGSVMRRPVRTSQRTFHDEAFIRNAKSFYWTFPISIFPLSSTVGAGSHFVASRSLVPSWSYKSFTPTCTDLIILYLISPLTFEIRAL